MMVRRERIPNPELVHHSETDAIRKGPLFVAMLAKPAWLRRGNVSDQSIPGGALRCVRLYQESPWRPDDCGAPAAE
jgi:hypothetical protein